jgi:hypothetical protein
MPRNASNEESVIESTDVADVPTDVPTDAPAADAKPKVTKTPPGEGEVTPVQFAKEIDIHLGQPEGTTKPQIVYGFVKNGKDFPLVDRGEGVTPRQTVPLEAGLAWIDAKATRKAEREAAKAAAAAAAPEAEAS